MDLEDKRWIMVSIVVPVYNTGNSVRKCVESLIHQSYQDTEIILVDDGSDYETASICDRLEQKYSDKISVYHCNNGGVSAARNYGIQKAKGKYIFFADSDDYAEPQMLEVMVKMAEQNQVQLVIAGYYFETPHVNKKKIVYESIAQKIPSIQIGTEEELKNAMVSLWDSSLMYNIWNKLFCLDLIKENQILFPVGKAFNEDRDFIREYLYHIQTSYVIEDCFYHYIRENEMSATDVYRSDMLEIRKEEFKSLKKFFKNLGIYNSISREYVSREHFDRVVGTVENMFHSSMSAREIRSEIRRITEDDDTKYAMLYAKPKSRKMKVLYVIFKMHITDVVYVVMKCIYLLRVKYPVLFYRLRQSR